MGLFSRFKKKDDYSGNLKQFARDYMDALNSIATQDTMNKLNVVFEEWMKFVQSKDIHDPNFYYANVIQMQGHEGMEEEVAMCLDLADKLDYYENSDPELNRLFRDTAHEALSRKKSISDVSNDNLEEALQYGRKFKECFENQEYDHLDGLAREWRDRCPFDPNAYYAFVLINPFNKEAAETLIEHAKNIKPEYVGEDIFLNKWYEDSANKIIELADAMDGKNIVTLR